MFANCPLYTPSRVPIPRSLLSIAQGWTTYKGRYKTKSLRLQLHLSQPVGLASQLRLERTETVCCPTGIQNTSDKIDTSLS